MTATDRDYERVFVGDRQINVTHFFPIRWTDDDGVNAQGGTPVTFAFGYWTHDGIFLQGFVRWVARDGCFGRPVFNQGA